LATQKDFFFLLWKRIRQRQRKGLKDVHRVFAARLVIMPALYFVFMTGHAPIHAETFAVAMTTGEYAYSAEAAEVCVNQFQQHTVKGIFHISRITTVSPRNVVPHLPL
jgi:hypothetical protein